MYKIEVEQKHKLITVTLGGLMTVEEVDEYISELRRAFIANRIQPPYLLIIDVSQCTIQSQDMIKRMGEHMLNMPKAKAIGVVTGSSLAKMQIRRLFVQPYARIVSDIYLARAWVINGSEPDD